MSRKLSVAAAALAAVAVPLAAQNTGIVLNNSVDGYVEVPYGPQVVPATGITFEAWITYDDSTIPSGWRWPTIARQGISVGGSENWFLRVGAGQTNQTVLVWKVVTATNQVAVSWPFSPGQLTTWTHVAATYDGALAALYVNGALVASLPGNGAPIRDVGSEVLRIGKGSDVATPIEVWNGGIDEARLWPFARSAAEIQQTMNMELSSVPGLVSTWNFNNDLTDSSSTLNATSSGAVTFTPNTLALTAPVLQPAFGFGASTPGCLGALRVSLGSTAQLGNTAFAVYCTRAPANAPAFFVASLGALPTPLPVIGVNLWVDPTASALSLTFANALGVARYPLPIPATAPAGISLSFQYGFVDSCGPQGFTASDAMTCVVLP